MSPEFEKWLEEEYYIFLRIPLKWHIIMLTVGLSLGTILGVLLKIYVHT